MAMAYGEADAYVAAVTETAVEPEPATPAVGAEIGPLVPAGSSRLVFRSALAVVVWCLEAAEAGAAKAVNDAAHCRDCCHHTERAQPVFASSFVGHMPSSRAISPNVWNLLLLPSP